MDIHVVRPGDTLYLIAQQYGVPMSQLIGDNQLPNPARLAVGQTIVVRYPKQVHTVRPGDTLAGVAQMHGLTVRQLWRYNPFLQGSTLLHPGQQLVVSYQQPQPDVPLIVNSYAYPGIGLELLRSTLPFLTSMAPFTYGFSPAGDLISPDADALVIQCRQMGTSPLLHLSSLGPDGQFSSEISQALLENPTAQQHLIDQVIQEVEQMGYEGVDIDFEYLPGYYAGPYADFVSNLRAATGGRPVVVAAAPKTSADQPGLLYEGHDYRLLSQAADYLFIMTYEWGYSFSPPKAVAPLPNVRRVLEFALTQAPAENLWMGIPSYGYNWTLPFQEGRRAPSLSPQEAVTLAVDHYASIRYDDFAQAPWFRYVDRQGQEHEVWFEDARSIRAKLNLAKEFGLAGVSYWNMMRPFPQNWVVLNSLFQIQEGIGGQRG